MHTRIAGAVLAATALGGCGLTPDLPGSQSQSAICIGCAGGLTLTHIVHGAAAAVDEAGAGADARGVEADASAPAAGTPPEATPAPTAPEPLASAVRAAEGLRLSPYADPGGIPHIGYGHRITAAEAEAMLAGDLAAAEAGAQRVAGEATWAALDPVRRDALTEAAFVLGPTGLGRFTRMLAALRTGDYASAAAELLDSRWATQAPARTARLAEALRTGKRVPPDPPAGVGAKLTPAE